MVFFIEDKGDPCTGHPTLEKFERNGGGVVEALGAFYLFYGLAILAGQYFVPSLQMLSKRLNIPDDVAGATFMALGCTAQETIVSSIALSNPEAGVTDLGFGTIVGSGLWSFLVIIGLSALFSPRNLEVAPAPFLRDSFVYFTSVGLLIIFMWDYKIVLYEAVILLAYYFLYVIFLFASKNLVPKWNEALRGWTHPTHPIQHRDRPMRDEEPLLKEGPMNAEAVPLTEEDVDEERASFAHKLGVVLGAPWRALYRVTIPDCSPGKGWEKWYLATFAICFGYLFLMSLCVIWFVKRLSCVLGWSSAFMGVVFVSIGTDMPDTVAVVETARAGLGDMAMSSIFGAQVLLVLVSLGLPAVISNSMGIPVEATSHGIFVAIVMLAGCILFMTSMIILSRMRVTKTQGFFQLIMYSVFLIYQWFAVYTGNI